MKAMVLNSRKTIEQTAKTSFIERQCRGVLLQKLKKLCDGELQLVEGSQVYRFGSSKKGTRPAEVVVRSPKAYASIVSGGGVGAAESYIRGEWDTTDLTKVMQYFLRNREVLESVEGGLSWIRRILDFLYHRGRRNTKQGSRSNITAHYDLGNDFFELFLDPTLCYSCAYFETPEKSLKEASLAKLNHLCRKLELKAQDHLLEIGSGWGALAVHAAKTYGCSVTTITLSKKQYEYTTNLVEREGLGHQITVELKDYRDVQGAFDKIVSVEMIEAIGPENLKGYFRKCSQLLKPNGIFVLQSITINDYLYDQAVRSVDFIKRHIFPGSFMPSVSAMMEAVKGQTDFRLDGLEDITEHYAKTLSIWRDNLLKQQSRLFELGFDESFLRKWLYYFAYCEGGFLERNVGDVQMVFTKPLYRKQHWQER